MLTEWSGTLERDTEVARVEEVIEIFAERLCQAFVYVYYASAVNLITICPQWDLQQYFINKKDLQRSLWCQCALQAIPPGKVGFSSVLVKLSVPQYKAISGAR